jgi:hypothetical protein
MTMQRLCHPRTALGPISLTVLIWSCAVGLVRGDTTADPPSDPASNPTNNYPTVARVEYVNECIAANGGKLASLYQCACAIDRIAAQLSYDDFVQAGTFAKYATLPGEGGGIFRDSDQAKKLAKLYRQIEGESRRSCGLEK